MEAARANHEAAVARLDDLRAPPDEDEVTQARASLDSARAGLTTAWARLDDLTAGSTANAIAQQELNVQLAEIALEEARDALDTLTLYAPFDGVVEAVNVRPGDRVGASLAAFSLSTSASIVIDLTVSEADLLGLAVGQAGLATFDAVEGVEYPVRIAAISRAPNTAQGVVTYDVQARLVTGPELAEIADALAVLSGGAGFDLGDLDLGALGSLGALGGARGGEGGAGRDALGGLGGAGRGGFGAGMLDAIDLPEGVTLEDVLEALASGEPLPEGVSLPDDLPIPPQMLQRIAAAVLAGGALDGGAGARPGAAAARPLPAPGMTASVTVLTELRDEAVLVPVAAVRQIGGAWYVAVPAAGIAAADGGGAAFERVAVEIGESDGERVEVTSGVEAGAVLLIGADTEGVAFSAIQPRAQALLPAFGPGGFPGGGVPRGGGGQ